MKLFEYGNLLNQFLLAYSSTVSCAPELKRRIFCNAFAMCDHYTLALEDLSFQFPVLKLTISTLCDANDKKSRWN